MPALICGSLAFDTITTFPGRFAQQILPDQMHILNVSFLVPTLRARVRRLRRQHRLHAGPARRRAGGDGRARRRWRRTTSRAFAAGGRTPSWCARVSDSYTAQAIIITDQDNNQITAFHPGAMQFAERTAVPRRDDLRLAIIAPDGRDAMLQHAQQLADAGIPFVFDPGQGLPMFDGAELQRFVSLASWVTVNDYEARMLAERTGSTIETDVTLAPARHRRDAGSPRLRDLAAGGETARAGHRGDGPRRSDRLRLTCLRHPLN